MTTTTMTTPRGATAAAAPVPRFADLCRGEWTKIRTVRSSGWFLLGMAALSIGFSAFYATKLVSSWSSLDAAATQGFAADPVAAILQPGATFGQLAVGALGVVLVASEYSTGMIRASVLAVPRRTPILGAKAVVFSVLVFVVALAVAVPAFLVGSAVTGELVPTSIGAAETVRAILAFGAFMVASGLIGLAIGAIAGAPVAGIGALIGLQYVVPLLSGLIPGSLGEHLLAALPATSSVVMSNGANVDNVYSPLASLAILATWTTVLLAAGSVSIKRRDVS